LRFEHPIRLAAPRARVDRGGALYLSTEPLPGFLAEARGARFALTPDEALIAAFGEWILPKAEEDHLTKSLMKLENQTPDIGLLVEGIKLLDLHAPKGAVHAYEKKVRQRAAVCLREACGGGLLWLCAACVSVAGEGLTKQ
jgi:hypothetical protein